MSDLTLSAGAHAFGDGSHPTTRGVMEALAALDPAEFAPAIACDIGAGSGILSFAIVQKFYCPVIATDILAESVTTIRENAAANNCADKIHALQANGFDHPDIRAHAPFDLIAMNILAEPLMALAADAESHLASSGVLIISGLLLWQEAQLREAYTALGLELTFRIAIGDWVTLVWQKP